MKLHWTIFALGTVITWGLYGAFLHKGSMGFLPDPNYRLKAFLFVGVAYLIVAIVGPLILIAASGKGFEFSNEKGGITLSIVAGVLGAAGALFAILALGANPTPGPAAASQVMSLIFAGAPIVAAIYGLILKPPAGGLTSLDWRFVVGLLLAASGGALVTLFKPV
jgi:uncharacterized membrane protein YeaQ/YmgE (transglycosylase-associated protein family)